VVVVMDPITGLEITFIVRENIYLIIKYQVFP
jgi:hypothetical protein